MTLGAPGDETTHRQVLEAVLAEATADHEAGNIIDLGFEWSRDDLRERQLHLVR
jgi:hypothetical protein